MSTVQSSIPGWLCLCMPVKLKILLACCLVPVYGLKNQSRSTIFIPLKAVVFLPQATVIHNK